MANIFDQVLSVLSRAAMSSGEEVTDVSSTLTSTEDQDSRNGRSRQGELNPYYNVEGAYLGTDNEHDGIVYLTTAYNIEYFTEKGVTDWVGTRKQSKQLSLDYTRFIRMASTVLGESAAGYNFIVKEEMFALASVHVRHPNTPAYGVSATTAVNFRERSRENRNDSQADKSAIVALINALTGGADYSNGAVAWDGIEQGQISGTECSEDGYGSHVAQIGWTIYNGHFDAWKEAIENLFPNTFIAQQHSPAIGCPRQEFNQGLYRYVSVAQHGFTIFWRDRGTGQ